MTPGEARTEIISSPFVDEAVSSGEAEEPGHSIVWRSPPFLAAADSKRVSAKGLVVAGSKGRRWSQWAMIISEVLVIQIPVEVQGAVVVLTDGRNGKIKL
jgi:hypothetical protein